MIWKLCLGAVSISIKPKTSPKSLFGRAFSKETGFHFSGVRAISPTYLG
jgi:hypothetical protein